jgi:hypothetical protein
LFLPVSATDSGGVLDRPILPPVSGDGQRLIVGEDVVPRNLHVKLTAKISNCNTKAVAGGKLPITGGTLIVNGILEAGASCADIADGTPPDFTFDRNTFNAKWTGIGAKPTQHPTVGKSHTNVASTGDYLLGMWEYVTDVLGDHDAFGGESAVLDLAIDNPLAVATCGRGDLDGNGTPLQLSQVSFSSVHGSQLSITP